MEKRRFGEALDYLDEISSVMEDSPEYLCDKGICLLKLGRLEEGLPLIQQAWKVNPRVKYGEPYLRVAEAYAKKHEVEKALDSLEELAKIHMSSWRGLLQAGGNVSRLAAKRKSQAILPGNR